MKKGPNCGRSKNKFKNQIIKKPNIYHILQLPVIFLLIHRFYGLFLHLQQNGKETPNFFSWSLERVSFPAKSHFRAEFPVSGAFIVLWCPIVSDYAIYTLNDITHPTQDHTTFLVLPKPLLTNYSQSIF